MFRAIGKAFLNRWNLLLLGAGLAFALLSGYPLEAASVVLAGEIAYLAFLGPRFLNSRPEVYRGADPEKTMQRVLAELPAHLRQRFEQVRHRCQELQNIAASLLNPHDALVANSLRQAQTQRINQLLWQYLRLLHTRYSLERFLDHTPPAQVESELRELRKRLIRIGNGTDENTRRLRRSVEDNLQTAQQRLDNLRRVEHNLDFVSHEIERLENKIKAVSEMAVHVQDPDQFAQQIDQVAVDMAHTEKTMNELRILAGVTPLTEEAPEILRAPQTEIRSR